MELVIYCSFVLLVVPFPPDCSSCTGTGKCTTRHSSKIYIAVGPPVVNMRINFIIAVLS